MRAIHNFVLCKRQVFFFSYIPHIARNKLFSYLEKKKNPPCPFMGKLVQLCVYYST